MIKRIELKNFMSHEHTVIEPGPGLTVLIGPNNVGKSAIVAALQILCYNENSTYVMRHGEKECSVKVETDDGHIIEWRRKNSPSYRIDGQKFDRLRGSGCPEELHQALRLPRVDGGNNDQFDIHFGSQKTPIFLLDRSGAAAAQFFASSSDAIRLVQMQQRHKEKIRDAKKEKTRLELESSELNAALKALEPAVQIEHHIERLEQDFRSITQLNEQIAEIEELTLKIDRIDQIRNQHQRESRLLDQLSQPPEFANTQALEELIAELRSAEFHCGYAGDLQTVLSELTAPPVLGDSRSLELEIARIESTQNSIDHEARKFGQLDSLCSPPQLEETLFLERLIDLIESSTHAGFTHQLSLDRISVITEPPIPMLIDPLQTLLGQLESCGREVLVLEDQQADLDRQLQAVEQEIRDMSIDQSCPVCGGTIDPDKVMHDALTGRASS